MAKDASNGNGSARAQQALFVGVLVGLVSFILLIAIMLNTGGARGGDSGKPVAAATHSGRSAGASGSERRASTDADAGTRVIGVRDGFTPAPPSNWSEPEDCSLRDEECWQKYERAALGGDVVAMYYLVNYLQAGAAGPLTMTSASNNAKAFVWAALARCTYTEDAALSSGGRLRVCAPSIVYEDEEEGARGRRGEVSQTPVLSPTEDECRANMNAVRDDLDRRYDQIVRDLSTDETDRAREGLADMLSSFGPPGLLMLGDLYRRGCGFDRDLVRGAAYYRASADGGSRLADRRWNEVVGSLRPEERRIAIDLAAQLDPSVRISRERRLYDALLRADEIRMTHVQEALAALNHYDGPIDGSLGSATISAIRKFQECERLPANGEPDDQLRVRIITRAALGGFDEDNRRIECHGAAKRHPRSQHVLGMMYMEGIGVPVDRSGAEANFSDAAKEGFAPSNAALAILYHSYIAAEETDAERRREYLNTACGYFRQYDRSAEEPLADHLSYLRVDLQSILRSGFRDQC